ncbi:isoprenoid biosynthesis glyoxalase ElbB [Phaeocystidibacter marisrubri]|uniref:Isoprenoid biosynthesis glyoxalase ElbB n=1 Tax=Phaeocystidibacter marisrubri TaxID=1577780 RepID=A0A6L3ZCY8_9FLAO|nr:isoprenoid biosynthesis glyoxalase ElbB [Phaeocystidibacter marisrubri]KAB2815733.1 isoprenoid biosynthesis glyoxalase ElbB [Phaeocystidibacter marisrubri]GGH65428.1 isoprenoid biosynthesis protein ElbB [Phaeocystidibacter marisrubri]
MKFAVLLHGSGVYDGTEIQEAVLTLLAIAERGHTYQCVAPDIQQHHVIDHTNGSEMEETRNVFVESARIARGEIVKLSDFDASPYDVLMMPGGFGTAKNFTKWAFEGPNGPINESVKNLILDFVSAGKPIGALCMSPTTVAKALEGSNYHSTLSVGSTAEGSPYDIAAISGGVEATGAKSEMKTVREVSVDESNKIVCAPCYMMDANIVEVKKNIELALDKILALI